MIFPSDMWLVCQDKTTGNLYVESRRTREISLHVLMQMGMPVGSIVLKEFEDLYDAEGYLVGITMVNKKINSILSSG